MQILLGVPKVAPNGQILDAVPLVVSDDPALIEAGSRVHTGKYSGLMVGRVIGLAFIPQPKPVANPDTLMQEVLAKSEQQAAEQAAEHKAKVEKAKGKKSP